MARKAGVVINETEYCKMDSTLLRTLTASRVMTPRSNHHFLIIMITTISPSLKAGSCALSPPRPAVNASRIRIYSSFSAVRLTAPSLGVSLGIANGAGPVIEWKEWAPGLAAEGLCWDVSGAHEVLAKGFCSGLSRLGLSISKSFAPKPVVVIKEFS